MKHDRLPASVRTLFGIRKRRALPPMGPKPCAGARICSGDVRLHVPASMSDALWQWLSCLGWREITFRPDRRRYMDIPEAWVQRLCEAPSDQWPQILLEATAAARARTPHPDAFREETIKRQAHRLPHFAKAKP